MKKPLALMLKKRLHKEIAKAQDLIVETIFAHIPNAVLHGGTAIWRCYNGSRFSEDLDFYFKRNVKKLDILFESLKSIGFDVLKKRIKENSIYSTLKFGVAEVRLEGVFKSVKSIVKEYELVDGTFITVRTLTPENLLLEKIDAYIKRRKIRDLYDVFYLLRFVKKEDVKKNVAVFLKNFKEPVDKHVLKSLILWGVVPDVKSMKSYMERWVR